mmetsp:Transcript_25346/g.43138  ORF Transcript_25346/g.43138 Transcript_25346/m.43138 type:complete len:95 (-) Transcript_25346:6-290(-)
MPIYRAGLRELNWPKYRERMYLTGVFHPSCWDDVNVDSPDHMSHVAYSSDRTALGSCPQTHPVKIPQIECFVRVYQYEGGVHVFSDGTTRTYAD